MFDVGRISGSKRVATVSDVDHTLTDKHIKKSVLLTVDMLNEDFSGHESQTSRLEVQIGMGQVGLSCAVGAE